jgi:predicted O-methyltransferase YrrM
MIEDIKSFLWFLLKGPKYYSTLVALTVTKLRPAKDSEHHIKVATKWCKENLTSIEDCFDKIGINGSDHNSIEDPFSQEYKLKISNIIDSSDSDFGGPGHTKLIYIICESLNITNAIETGVAYGWSSAAILKSLAKRNGLLVSIDMPMLKQTDYDLIGVAVDSDLQDFWELRREPDRYGLPRAISAMDKDIDLVHYDSDKSYYGRKWSQEIIWKNIKIGGIFISDDVEDNTAFMEFVHKYNLEYNILEFENKYVGVIKKIK